MEKRGKTLAKFYAVLLLTSIIIVSLAATVFAAEGVENTTAWNKKFSSAIAFGSDFARSSAIDSNNNLYVVGWGQMLYNATSNDDWWLKKFNSNGVENTTAWNKNFTGPKGQGSDRANAVAIDGNNNIYVVGSGENLANGSSAADWWLKKFDSNGVENTTAWNKNFSSSGANNDGANAVAIDGNNNIYVVGYGRNLYGTSSGTDWWIKKFSSSGVEDTANWNKNFSSSGANTDMAYSVAIDSNNNIYIVGYGNALASGSSVSDWWIKKFSSSGVEDTANWNKNVSISSTGADMAYSVAVDSNNNVYVGGWSEKAFNSTSYIDWEIKKFNSTGSEDTANWNKNFTGFGVNSDDRVYSVAIDHYNNVFVSGIGANLFRSSSSGDWWIKKFDSNGVENTTAWNKNFSATTDTKTDYAYSITVDQNNNIFVAGSGNGLIDNDDWWIKKFQGSDAPPASAPNTTTFDSGSTNFSAVANLSSVPNMTLAKTNTFVRWVGSVNAAGKDFDNNIKIGSKFISINVSALDSTINTPALINMTGINCTSFRIYYAAGYYATADNLIAAGTKIADQNNIGGNCADATKCTSLSCSGGVLSFTAQHFDGFGIGEGSLTNLTIYDDSDSQPVYANSSIHFFANFLNLSNAPANTTNGGCKINFEFPTTYGSYQDMIFNSTSNLYQFINTFSTNGTYNWKVNCTGSGDTVLATDTFTISAGTGEVPEFSTIAIIAAITLAIASIFFIRSRNN